VFGAALDVFEQEPPFTSGDYAETWNSLIQTGKVVCTPHIAGWTQESKRRMAQILYDQIKAMGFKQIS
jgi:D-3-phosphoglycerate dehydrogenase